ncbi:hypothetical protein DPMN_026607 [Dreissena polymorpha]|uniref:Uncharacterized protein n=1 Tax=Dreissena polymorpha TaxID=45954 RepID=A0A9D4LTR1_DREPO|nr:hypothetical protein DPMN_026607 [Dreissena polymorpha]
MVGRAVHHDVPLPIAGLHPVCFFSFIKSIGKILEFTAGPISSISSANLKLEMVLPPIEVEVWWIWRVLCVIFSKKRLNRTKESIYDRRPLMS